MNALSFLASVNAPHDLWTILINWIQGGVGNLGWTILILTLLVKVVTSPLDFMVKYTTKKQTLVQQKCGPQIAKLKKKYGNNEQMIRTQTTAIYKREGLKMGTGCLVMIVNLILTCTIFFSFYGTLKRVSAYEAINQYEIIENTYEQKYYESMASFSDTDEFVTADDAKTWVENYNSLNKKEEKTDAETAELNSLNAFIDNHSSLFESATNDAYKSATEKWKSIKSSWLWVQNIWVADATTKPFPTYDSLKTMAKNAGTYYKTYVEENIAEEDYNKISTIVSSSTRSKNGYYILAVLAGVVTLLSQIITDLHNKLKNKKANKLAKATNSQNTMSMKVMKIIMPIIMVMFVLSASASFGIYILASNVASIILGELITLIVDHLTKNKRKEVEAELEKEADRLIRKGLLQE